MSAKKRQSEDVEARNLRMTPDVWAAVDADASRCERSTNGHIIAILKDYLGLADTHALVNYSALRGVPMRGIAARLRGLIV